MGNELHHEAERLFLAALEEPAETRGSFVERSSTGDPALRAATVRLLRAHGALGDFLETPAPPMAHEPAPGDRIGRYQLLEKLGEGGVGVVFLAEQAEPFRRRVALKVIKPGMDSREVIARFESERQALALMDHPNIAKVFDAGTIPQSGGRPYFVMELVAGIPCHRFCDDERLTVDERLELFVKICRGIEHAHSRGIIHRDIKPANILVSRPDPAPADPVPKVIDFGIAKATEVALTEKTVFTSLTHFMGTPAYMSPEQARGGRGLDVRSDVYSLGALLHVLLVGRTPFDSDALASAGIDELRRRILEEEPEPPGARLAALDPEAQRTIARQRQLDPPALLAVARGELGWIMLRCLEKDPARRFASAQALAEEVGRYRRRERLTTTPPSAFARWKSYARNHGAARWLGAAAAAAVDGWSFSRRPGRASEAAPSIGHAANAAPGPSFDAEARAATRGRTQDVEAYRAYVDGRHCLDRLTKESLDRSVACFRRAIARDGNFALAWVGLSMAHESLAKWGDASFDEAFRVAREAAERALAIDPGLADAHVAMAKVQMGYDWDWQAADASLRRALALAPANASVWVAAAALAMCLGQHERALLLGRRAVELDPGLFAAHQYLALIHLVAGRLDDAEVEVERMLTLSPESDMSYWVLCIAAVERGQMERALEFARQEKDVAFRLVLLGVVHHVRGSAAEADAVLAELARDHEVQASYQIAQVHAFRGNRDAAFVWLEWAFRRHDAGLGFAKVDPCLRPLRHDPRWGALMRRLRLEE